jgi:hypothetical protein
VSDVFEEVEEQLRSDRYKALALRLLPWVVGALALALVAALGVWGWREYTERESAKASETYSQALDAFGAGKLDHAKRLWTEVSTSRSRSYKTLALMQLGGMEMADDNAAAAVRHFDAAAEAAPSPVLEDAARLKSALALVDTAPLKDMEARLKPLMEEGRPYRIQAREALAFAKLMGGDLTGARGDFVVLALNSDASQDVRQRAEAAKGLIDSGAVKSLPAAVKAAAALPRPAPQAPGAPPPAAPPAPQPQAPGPQ